MAGLELGKKQALSRVNAMQNAKMMLVAVANHESLIWSVSAAVIRRE